MQVKNVPINEIREYPNNPRKNDDAVEKVANSIREFGWQQPIVVDADGVVIVGHTRLKAAQKMGLETVPVTVAEGLTDNQVQAYRLADNKTGELAEWDFDKLNEELEGIDWLACDMEQFGFYIGDGGGDENPYSREVSALVYEPTGDTPSIFDLCDIEKSNGLKRSIEESGLPQHEKEFLQLAAMRHVVFDYAKIANYYANASAEMQRLMEDSALVIVDYGRAIELGYVRLRDSIELPEGFADEV